MSAESTPASGPQHRTFRLTPSRWRGWRRELPGGFFVLYFMVGVVQPFMAPVLGSLPGLCMAACALVAVWLGTTTQRVAGALCFGLALVAALYGHRSMLTRIEHRAPTAVEYRQP